MVNRYFRHDDVVEWKHFPRFCSFVREFTGPRWITRTKASGFDVFFDLRPNKRLSKQSGGWWFETLSRSLYCNAAKWVKQGNEGNWFSPGDCRGYRLRLRQCLFSINTVNIHKRRRDNIKVFIYSYGAHAILIFNIAGYLCMETSTKVSSEPLSWMPPWEAV